MTHPIQIHVRKILRAYAADNENVETELRKIEPAGGRIIAGGQTGADLWEITDLRTGEVIASGDGGLEGYDKVAKRLDPDSRWHHFDRISEEFLSEASPTEGVPSSLAQALEDWVESTSTQDEETAQVAAWSVAEVQRCLGWLQGPWLICRSVWDCRQRSVGRRPWPRARSEALGGMTF